MNTRAPTEHKLDTLKATRITLEAPHDYLTELYALSIGDDKQFYLALRGQLDSLRALIEVQIRKVEAQ